MEEIAQNSVVVGGSSGIGRAVAIMLAQQGHHVVVTGRREQKLLDVVAENPGPGTIAAKQVDISDRSAVDHFFKEVRHDTGPLDLLVIAAGINIPNRSFGAMQPVDWDSVLQTNVTGTYNCMQAVLPEMRSRRAGLIININSIAGVRPSNLGGIAYSASKFAQNALGKTVAKEVGPEGVRITNVCPGEVNTELLGHRPEPLSDEHLQRILQPEDVAQVVQMIVALPTHVHIGEVTVTAAWQPFS